MSHNVQIKEGAFVVSDAHYSHHRPQLLDFLKEIHSKKLTTYSAPPYGRYL